MPTAESEPGVFFIIIIIFLFFFSSLKEIGKEGTVRADAVRGAFLSLETNRAFSRRNLCLPWEFTASQQKFGKRFRLKDFSSWRKKKKEKKKHVMNQMQVAAGPKVQ